MISRPVIPFRRPRKRGAARLFSLSALVVSAALGATPAAAQAPPPQAAVAPRRSCGSTSPPVRSMPRSGPSKPPTGLSVVVQLPADTVGMMESPGVSGTYTIDAALEALLDGTVAGRHAHGHRDDHHRRARRPRIARGHRRGCPASSRRSYTTTLSATPQTIQVIPQAAMSEQGSFTLSDAMRNVPGITLQAGEGGGASGTAGDMFNMRGFSAANSLFVDNVRDDGLITRDVFNLEQVEVYLGPTGSDVGRGNAAGYVNMATKTPRLGSTYSGALTYGTADAVRATADLNVQLPLGEPGSWLAGTAMRLNAMWQDGGVAGRDYAENERKAIAPSLALGLGTPTRVTVRRGSSPARTTCPDYGIPGAAWDEPLTPTSVLTTRPVDQENYYGSPDVDFDTCRADQRDGAARARPRRRLVAAQPDPLQRDLARRGHHGDPVGGQLRAGDRDRHLQPPGQLPRERDPRRTRRR